tara:strand:+ start:4218 stop:4976 length:759 start_codon:yes stop_codon:yes gene_type:complete
MNPILSIITATYNSDKTLDDTIQSLLNQNYNNYEYILIDGKSKDNTLEIIKKYEPIFQGKKITYTWISEKDSGIYNAWNKGLKLAKGKWISFLGSDDIYLENALEKYAYQIFKNTDVDFIHSKVKLMDGKKTTFIISDKWVWKNFKREMKIAHVGSFHNKYFFEKYGNFNEKYKIIGDYEMLLRAKNNLKTLFFDDFTAEMKVGGVSNENIIGAFKEVREAKINTAKINELIAYFDFYFFILKYYLSKIFKK